MLWLWAKPLPIVNPAMSFHARYIAIVAKSHTAEARIVRPQTISKPSRATIASANIAIAEAIMVADMGTSSKNGITSARRRHREAHKRSTGCSTSNVILCRVMLSMKRAGLASQPTILSTFLLDILLLRMNWGSQSFSRPSMIWNAIKPMMKAQAEAKPNMALSGDIITRAGTSISGAKAPSPICSIISEIETYLTLLPASSTQFSTSSIDSGSQFSSMIKMRRMQEPKVP